MWITWITQNKWLVYVIFKWISGKIKVLISQINHKLVYIIPQLYLVLQKYYKHNIGYQHKRGKINFNCFVMLINTIIGKPWLAYLQKSKLLRNLICTHIRNKNFRNCYSTVLILIIFKNCGNSSADCKT